MVKNKEDIQKRILEFFDQLKIESKNYILDLFVGEKEIKVIELNAFEDATGTLLFSWKNDRKILMEGPFEFRVRNEPLKDFSFIQKEFKHFFV